MVIFNSASASASLEEDEKNAHENVNFIQDLLTMLEQKWMEAIILIDAYLCRFGSTSL